jgi:hypothetical protein
MDENLWFQIDSEMMKKIGDGAYYNFSIVPGFEPIKIDWSVWSDYDSGAMVWKVKRLKSQDALDKLSWMYTHHIMSRSGYYVNLPSYYFGLFNILN